MDRKPKNVTTVMAFSRIHRTGTNVSVLLMSNSITQNECCRRRRRSLIYSRVRTYIEECLEANESLQTNVVWRGAFFMNRPAVPLVNKPSCLYTLTITTQCANAPAFSCPYTDTLQCWAKSTGFKMWWATQVHMQRHLGRTLISLAQIPCTCSHY